jgi:hypothetical protein
MARQHGPHGCHVDPVGYNAAQRAITGKYPREQRERSDWVHYCDSAMRSITLLYGRKCINCGAARPRDDEEAG